MQEQTQSGRQQTERELLEVTRALGREMAASPQEPPITLDSSLEGDLGLDSLARVELVARVESHFGVALPEAVFANAETPRDLLRALGTADKVRPETGPRPVAGVGVESAEPAPLSAATLVDVLAWHVEAHPDRSHVQFHSEAGDGSELTYRALWEGAVAIAAGLQAGGMEPGDAIALILPTGRDYLVSFFGILLAGGVPVPVYPPGRPAQLEDHLERHARILENCRARTIVANVDTTRVARWLRSAVASVGRVTTAAALEDAAGRYQRPAVSETDMALLQYTSGSTGQPKGVVLTHANLLANIRAMGRHINASADDVCVSWLPLYHDMGLIGAWLGSLYFAARFVVMPPIRFLAAPQRWLWAMHQYGGTLSAAPNFGYELCLQRIADADIEGLDLGHWRIAFNGAEAVSARTLEAFCARFGAYGFRREAMTPVYGLAENSVGLAFPPPGRGPRIDRIDRRVFMDRGLARPAADDPDAMAVPACGYPLAGHQMRVIDSDGRELPDRQEGRIQFQGPSATGGYYRNAAKTAALFDGDWLNTGDLGYTVDGEIYVTGRTKDIVIRGGRNIYPEELEQAIGDLQDVRTGRVAVFGAADAHTGTERLIVVAETRQTEPARRQLLRKRINKLAMDLVEMPPDDIVLAPPGSLLKTSSGKLRRAAIRERYEQGAAARPPLPPWRQWLAIQRTRLGPGLVRASRSMIMRFYAGYTWSWYGLLAPFVWFGLMLPTGLRWRWRVMHGVAKFFRLVTATSITVKGEENLPKSQPCIVIANHQSYLDPYVMVWLLPAPVRFVAKVELSRKRSTNLPLRRMGCLFVERFDTARGSADARMLTEFAKAGDSLGFFPEGTFTRMPGLRPFHMGAFITAAEADLPIVPVTIRGTRSMLRADSWFPRRGRISLTVGRAIVPACVREPADSVWQTAIRLRDAARAVMLANSGEPDLAGQRNPPPTN